MSWEWIYWFERWEASKSMLNDEFPYSAGFFTFIGRFDGKMWVTWVLNHHPRTWNSLHVISQCFSCEMDMICITLDWPLNPCQPAELWRMPIVHLLRIFSRFPPKFSRLSKNLWCLQWLSLWCLCFDSMMASSADVIFYSLLRSCHVFPTGGHGVCLSSCSKVLF